MAEAYLGELRQVAFNYAPINWLLCQGQVLQVSQYAALFSLLGNRYGGDGKTTFALPDLRGRVTTGVGQGPLGALALAQTGGTSSKTVTGNGSVTLTQDNMPAHTHGAQFIPVTSPVVQPTITVSVSKDNATVPNAPSGGYLAVAKAPTGTTTNIYSSTATSGTTTLNSLTAVASGGSGGGITGGSVTISSTGQIQPQAVPVSVSAALDPAMPPFVAVNYMICVNGIWPPQP